MIRADKAAATRCADTDPSPRIELQHAASLDFEILEYPTHGRVRGSIHRTE
jgi:hypothetical protein